MSNPISDRERDKLFGKDPLGLDGPPNGWDTPVQVQVLNRTAPLPVEDVTSIEEQLERNLRNPLVAVQDVMAFLEYHGEAAQAEMPPDKFFKGEEDMANWRSAMAWWPEADDMPYTLRRPELSMLLSNYSEPWQLEDGQCITFIERLTYLATKANRWFNQHNKKVGRPRVLPTLPGETDDERRRRLNRERQERYKERKGQSTNSELVAARKELNRLLAEGKASKHAAIVQWDAYLASIKLQLAQLNKKDT